VTGSTPLRGSGVRTPRTLRTPAEFQRVLQGGRRFVQGRVVLYVLPPGDAAAGGSRPRVGFVTGRRIGGAVLRNRARRLLREAWRALVPALPEGTEAVLVARPEIRGAKAGDVADDVRRALSRAGATAS
jgi:ribonuclease P protein component